MLKGTCMSKRGWRLKPTKTEKFWLFWVIIWLCSFKCESNLKKREWWKKCQGEQSERRWNQFLENNLWPETATLTRTKSVKQNSSDQMKLNPQVIYKIKNKNTPSPRAVNSHNHTTQTLPTQRNSGLSHLLSVSLRTPRPNWWVESVKERRERERNATTHGRSVGT